MNLLKTGALSTCLALVAAVGLSTSAQAADAKCGFPKKPIKIIVGFSAGGGTDTYARILSSVIPEYINEQPLIIINKTGGAQVPAMKYTKKAKPDGYTMQFFSVGSGVVATMMRDRGVKWFRDFVPVAQIGQISITVAVNKASPSRTPQELVAAIKKAAKAGNKLRWGHPGRGSITHLAVTAWLLKNNVAHLTQDIPFKGGAPTRAALLGQQVDFGSLGVHHMTGFRDRLHPIGVTSAVRDLIVKDAKTMEEQKSPYVDMNSPMVMAAPAGTPQSVIDCFDAAIKKATQHKAFRKLTKKAGLAVIYRNAADSKALLLKLRDAWKPTIDFVKKRMAKK